MKKVVAEYAIELVIALIGVLVGFIELLIVRNNDLAAIIVVFSFLLSLTSIAIRQEIAEQVSQQLELRRIIQSISNKQWRIDAERELEALKLRFQNWADGHRVIPIEDSIPYQIDLVRQAKKEIRAIHVIHSFNGVNVWMDSSKAFYRLAEALRLLDTAIQKRRLFVCDRTKCFKELKKDVVRVLQKQVLPAEQGGQGAKVRILWSSVLRAANRALPPDLLIVDKNEVVVVKGLGSPTWTVEAYTNEAVVETYRKMFDSYWKVAEPVEKYLEEV